MCVICFKTLAAYSKKPTELRRHIGLVHTWYLNAFLSTRSVDKGCLDVQMFVIFDHFHPLL